MNNFLCFCIGYNGIVDLNLLIVHVVLKLYILSMHSSVYYTFIIFLPSILTFKYCSQL